MSRATKRKHVTREVLEEHVVPAPQQRIVRVLGSPGNNLHQVETAEGSRFLASMPARFRHHVWIKRGDFLLVDPIEEGAKVKAEMALLLLRPHIRFLQRQGLWPAAFAGSLEPSREERDGEAELFVNTNRGSDSEEEEEEEEEEEPEEEEEEPEEEEEEPEEEDTKGEGEEAGEEETAGKRPEGGAAT